MELFIRIKDGQPFEHPILKDNFCQAFPNIDLNNLPSEFARFERIAPPELGPYELYEGVTYEKIGEVYKDVHHVRQMTVEEKTALQEQAKLLWNNRYPSWTFDEQSCSFVAPVAMPTDGKIYSWDESQLNWVEVVIPEAPVEAVVEAPAEVVIPVETNDTVTLTDVSVDTITLSSVEPTISLDLSTGSDTVTGSATPTI